jgi:putative spermidine/putrescine transport system ATP-binding protein/spermidine/putrescine transport system ATP-binding protein
MSGGRICQIDTPERLYRKPADRFVASFIGEGSLLKAKLERMDGDSAIVSVGGAKVTVPAKPLFGIGAGDSVDLFVRPEHLHVAAAGEAALQGVVAASIYQGDHVDLYIDVPQAASGRIHMRLSAREAAGLTGAGSKIGIGLDSEDAVAFPQDRSAS